MKLFFEILIIFLASVNLLLTRFALVRLKQPTTVPLWLIKVFTSLKKASVPVAMHLIPQTDHGFDLFLPKISPAAHNAIYDVEDFLAMMAIREPVVELNETS
jgi:hypothetical protein